MDERLLTDKEFQQFRDLIYQKAGISLSEAKRQLVQSRLQKRLRFYNFHDFGQYHALLISVNAPPDELETFINCITTNKTDFYREPQHFDFVTHVIIPKMFEKADQNGTKAKLSVWHAGCSTGEEPYTLAITLAEAQRNLGMFDYRQLASDIDTDVLAHAERGVYHADRIDPVPTELQRRYFLRGRDTQSNLFQVRRELREPITFRQINLIENLWPLRATTQFDVIFCRNVVIYFDKPTQRKLFARFEERLHPGGYLIIGHSESLLGISDAFDSLGATVYQRPTGPKVLLKAA